MEVTIFIAFFAGLASFLSPCVFPLIPGLIAYLAGTSLTDTSRSSRMNNMRTALFFALGMSTVFVLVGVVLSLLAPQLKGSAQSLFRYAGGVLIVLFGIMLTGIVKVPFLEREHRIEGRRLRFAGAYLLGMTFAIGWTPCIGPILGFIYTLAFTEPSISIILMIAYSIGFGIPFILAGVLAHEAIGFIKRSGRVLAIAKVVMGILIILIGIGILTGWFYALSDFSLASRLLTQ